MNTPRTGVFAAAAAVLLLAACAATPPKAAAPADATPATANEKLSADGLFAFGKSSLDDLSSEGRAQLDALASRLLTGRPFEIVHVIGHSDRIGSPKANLDLSNRRATAVRKYLVEKGVPAERITAVGRGAVEPIVACDDVSGDALIACLAPNRRVEIRVVAAG
jgi:outer membrane protein OmpA-like peptidoglycan-associated protein